MRPAEYHINESNIVIGYSSGSINSVNNFY